MGVGKDLVVFFKEGGKVLFKAMASTISEAMLRDRMSKAEAEMILDISPSVSRDRMKDTFFEMYCANAKENGGSPYIQSKILGAYTVLSGASPKSVDFLEANRRICQRNTEKALHTKNKRVRL
ncbi:hypothetical protein EHEL_110580 [Encephalitozoon hellem ATCC 50504]|uniref:Uncharacterized protein n=1 Tax=Encephalitozoon hellem TaxID=27973 RepID=A0A9Q9C535_ENCHE|nr:uncharacterized protein EHEL_110580 [Encephalitozoon hellem ATCC 50504]AFM99332.1 hypothetical protein EHEL_110580 [Encephalitozoon hellem ATCC 50504]UTX44336.1 hypothetical protein GPU96_11g21350 [Encephalitozoon hellem]WEL39837.1 hypothetical protein PFJ87_11g00740 [Encephalitozoon hellem]|eukprot:XP_003888313.1 hypothetical protein EHEL_110580 [Encephalitozoon hellem ATCC 50504]